MFFYKRLRSYRFVITSDMNFIIWIFNYSFIIGEFKCTVFPIQMYKKV